MNGIVERSLVKRIDWDTLEALGVVGIDEIALRKGHRDFHADYETTVKGTLCQPCKHRPDRY